MKKREFADKAICAACIASRRSVVDSFMEGYLAGFRTAVVTANEDLKDVQPPQFCLEHDKMIIEAHVRDLKSIVGG